MTVSTLPSSSDASDAPAGRRFGRTTRRAVLGGAVAASLALTGLGVATAAAVAGTHHAPTSDAGIPNLGLVENEISTYYGDTVVDGEHYASPTSAYAHQMYGIEARVQRRLATTAPHAHGKPALVLDVDDTTLSTYNYEYEQGFGYTVPSNTAYIDAEKMPAVFGMPQLANWAQAHGITVFYITGRPESQRDATEGNLAKVGYKAPADATHLFLKNPTDPPAYLSCAAACTTDEYKSQTRAHLQAEGYDVLADIGDQYSDLSDGHADAVYKLPNPMYYIP